MGLLGEGWDDPRSMATMQLAAGLLGGGNFGQALGRGLSGYNDSLQNDAKMKYMKQQMESQATENELRKAQVAKALKDQAKLQQIEDLAPQFYKSGQSAESNALGTAATAGRVGPTPLAAALIPQSQATGPSFDMAGYMNALMKIDPLAAIKMQQDAQKANEIQLKPGEQIFDRTSGKVKFGVPETPDLTYIPGDGYNPPVMVDKKKGIVPITGPGVSGSQPSPTNGYQQPQGNFTQLQGGFQPGQRVPQDSPAVDPNAPWRGMPPKVADEMRKSVYEAESKKLDELRASVSKGQKTLSALERFGELNRQTGTGGVVDKFLPDWLTTNDDKQQMLSIQDALAPTMRAPGSGSSSDTDVRLMKSGLPGINKSGNVNRDIRTNYANQLKNDQNELAFKERYLAQYGHLNGADEAYQASQKPSGSQTGQQAAQPALTPRAKLLNSEQRAALEIVLKSRDENLMRQARAKGWIQ